MKRLVLGYLAALLLVATASAQPPQQPPPGAGPGAGPGRGPRVNSPEVLPDGRVTFRFHAPEASGVQLRFGEGTPDEYDMEKGDDGIWSVTIGPIEPALCMYSFLVDGVKVIDLANPLIRMLGTNIDSSMLDIWSGEPRFDQVQDVPHGSLNIHTYTSSARDIPRGLYVYVPAAYYEQPDRRFPVLYLWHGGSGSETDWSLQGRTPVIMDNLIAQEKAVPMILVSATHNLNRPIAGYPLPEENISQGPGGMAYDALKEEIVNDIIPFVASHYRTIEDRTGRAIAGLSAGGGVSMNVGMGSLDLFANVGEFSSGMFGGVSGFAEFDINEISPGFYDDVEATNEKLDVFFMSVGTEDPRLESQQKAYQDFVAHGIDVSFTSYPGGHEWVVWRHSVADFVQKLFREE